MIRITGLSFKYRERDAYAIRDLSAEIRTDGVTILVGESGVGKSTLLALLSGIYIAGDSLVGSLVGEIRIDDRQPKELRGPTVVSWVPQEGFLLDHLTVRENVMLPTEVGGRNDDTDGLLATLMKRLGIEELASRRPGQLSGGERTRVSLARALVTRSRYLFLDEPFASLDLGTRWRIYEIIQTERRRPGMTTIMTTHDISEAMLLADHISVMSRGLKTELEFVQMKPRIDVLAEPSRDCLAEARSRSLDVEDRIYLEKDG